MATVPGGIPAVAYPPFWMDSEDHIFVEWRSSVAGDLWLQGRFLTPEGDILKVSKVITTAADRADLASIQSTGTGWLLNLSVTNWHAALGSTGVCYVQVGILRGGTSWMADVSAILMQGYVASYAGLFWPGGHYTKPEEGPGRVYSVAGSVPAAGADPYISVPNNARWRILNLTATLVAGVGVANRYVRSRVFDGSAYYYVTTLCPVQTASQTRYYDWTPGGVNEAAFDAAGHILLAYPQLILPGGYALDIVTTAIAAADQWTAITALVEEWISV